MRPLQTQHGTSSYLPLGLYVSLFVLLALPTAAVMPSSLTLLLSGHQCGCSKFNIERAPTCDLASMSACLSASLLALRMVAPDSPPAVPPGHDLLCKVCSSACLLAIHAAALNLLQYPYQLFCQTITLADSLTITCCRYRAWRPSRLQAVNCVGDASIWLLFELVRI